MWLDLLKYTIVSVCLIETPILPHLNGPVTSLYKCGQVHMCSSKLECARDPGYPLIKHLLDAHSVRQILYTELHLPYLPCLNPCPGLLLQKFCYLLRHFDNVLTFTK